MTRNIAVEGDVVAIPGAVPYPPAVAGAWIPGSVSYRSYDSLKVGGVAVIHEAECQFTFTGVDPNGVTVTGDETVTLSASSTAVNDDQSSVLLLGDTEIGSYANQLVCVASNTAFTP